MLAIWLELPEGGRVKLRELGAGECLGEMGLYREESRSATVLAEGPARLWKLTSGQLERIEEFSPALALALHRHLAGLLAERLVHSNTHLKTPLAQLASAIHDLADNQFVARADEEARLAEAARRGDEVGAVAGAIQALRERLDAYLDELRRATAHREQIESELRIAGRIQMSFLPAPLRVSEAARVDFAAFSRPAKEAGGDLYDGFFIDETRFFFVIGDVSGKGVSAALFMAVTAMCLRALARDIQPADRLLARVNELLCQRNDTMQFVTLLAGVFTPSTGELEWTNCGHPAPLLLGPFGSVSALEEGRGPPAGVFEGSGFELQRRTIKSEEILLLYTDGVTEALDPDQTLYGEARLERLLSEARPAGSRDCVELIVKDVETFARGAAQADDITLVALKPARR
jgi:sigma-B regulation protein RsbU (phosphoserine phosphatase)